MFFGIADSTGSTTYQSYQSQIVDRQPRPWVLVSTPTW